jgi:hypothetical protein
MVYNGFPRPAHSFVPAMSANKLMSHLFSTATAVPAMPWRGTIPKIKGPSYHFAAENIIFFTVPVGS